MGPISKGKQDSGSWSADKIPFLYLRSYYIAVFVHGNSFSGTLMTCVLHFNEKIQGMKEGKRGRQSERERIISIHK